MIASKHIGVIAVLMACFSVLLCGFFVYAANTWDTAKMPEYQQKIFNDEIIEIDIEIDEEEWQGLLDNAQTKEWISGTLVINGERFSTVGIRTKGNSSLTQSNDGRYSLQFKFNKFVKGQTYYGLDAFCINNMMGDATYMKDYISYEIMEYIGIDVPLTNYANVTVNGEHYGFCIALERYHKAYLDRVYNTSAGELYSVKTLMGQKNKNFDGDANMPDFNDGENPMKFKEGSERPDFSKENETPDFTQKSMGGGGSLLYTDDNPESYSSIFENAVFGTVSEKDQQRVITAIENLNAGTDLEKYFDVDEILRYLAAHTVVVNLDSYSSNMEQNYYIYEQNGKIRILPWDYGLAFGGFQSDDASSVVNFPIDTPVSGVSMEDRPLLNKLLEVDEYMERYHSYLNQIVEGFFESGLFEETINNADNKISNYVKKDTTALYTFEQYKESLQELVNLGNLRAESIRGQLNGTIPSTSDGQSLDKSALIDAASVDLSALGSMMGGKGQGGQPGSRDMFEGDMAAFKQDKQSGDKMEHRGRPDASGVFENQEESIAAANPLSVLVMAVSMLLLIGAIIFVAKPGKNTI